MEMQLSSFLDGKKTCGRNNKVTKTAMPNQLDVSTSLLVILLGTNYKVVLNVLPQC
uniref:Uncharacterized protein n=1 Tax=Rhizophora mucronata TaxID=61149 RepID=A0A2P2N4F4_RHIMU